MAADSTHLTRIVQPKHLQRPVARSTSLIEILKDQAVNTLAFEVASSGEGTKLFVRSHPGSSVGDLVRSRYIDGRVEGVAPADDPMKPADHERMWTLKVTVSGHDLLPLQVPIKGTEYTLDDDPLAELASQFSNLEHGARGIVRFLVKRVSSDHFLDTYSSLQAERDNRAAEERTRTSDGPRWRHLPFLLAVPTLILTVVFWFLGENFDSFWVDLAGIALATTIALPAVGVVILAIRWLWQRRTRHDRYLDLSPTDRRLDAVPFEIEIQAHIVLTGQYATRQTADGLLSNFLSALKQYDNQRGSSLETTGMDEGPPDRLLELPSDRLWSSGRRAYIGSHELGALWHCPPIGAHRMSFTPLLKLGGNDSSGAQIGTLVAGDARPAFLESDVLRMHHLYVASTGGGKSTLMGHVLRHRMIEKARGDYEGAIVVVDPHADLVRNLLTLVPHSLRPRVRLIDLSDDRHVPGINPLDTAIFQDRDHTCDAIVRVFRAQSEYWGPRIQNILQYSLKTLHEANTRLPRDKQFTLLDLDTLLGDDDDFRQEVLDLVSDWELVRWWERTFGSWSDRQRREYILPIQTRLGSYASSQVARRIVGQPDSTLDLAGAIADGDVLLISTFAGPGGEDVSELVGSTMLNLVDSITRRQGQLPRHERQAVTIVVDEMQSIPGVNYHLIMNEIRKYGGNLVMACQSLDNLDLVAPNLRKTIFSNVGCLAAFNCSGQDSRAVELELGSEAIDHTDITGLPPLHCHVQAGTGEGRRIPPYTVELNPPRDENTDMPDLISEDSRAYTRTADEADRIVERRANRLSAGLHSGSRQDRAVRSRRNRRGHSGPYATGDGTLSSFGQPPTTRDDIQRRMEGPGWGGRTDENRDG